MSFKEARQFLGTTYVPDRWIDEDHKFKDEISLNPVYWRDGSLLTIFQTLVHEMCHQWQKHFGKQSRNGYHNKEWADKMESLGLMPSSTGTNDPLAKRTGQKMSDYPVNDGAFIQAAESLVSGGYSFGFLDRYAGQAVPIQNRSEAGKIINKKLTTPLLDKVRLRLLKTTEKKQTSDIQSKRKISYACTACGIKLWGKPDLFVKCGECDVPLIDQSKEK